MKPPVACLQGQPGVEVVQTCSSLSFLRDTPSFLGLLLSWSHVGTHPIIQVWAHLCLALRNIRVVQGFCSSRT